jgi:hypothetical protein
MPQPSFSVDYAGEMIQYNNWLFAGPSSVVTFEAMIGSYAVQTPSTNFYGGGDGSTTDFQTGLPFIQGTERITVNGVLKALSTDYSYKNFITVTLPNGVVLSLAGGVSFNAAPTNGLPVSASYTAMDGYKTVCGPLANTVDLRKTVSIDANGNPNGMWWALANGTVYATGSASGPNTQTTFNTALPGTDTYRGYCIRITGDTSTPAAIGQVQTITKHSTTQLAVSGWVTTPSSAATFEIIDGTTIEGTHPSGKMSAAMAQSADAQVMINS